MRIVSPEELFKPIDRAITDSEKIDIIAIIAERMKAKTTFLTASDGEILDEIDKVDFMTSLYELNKEARQIIEVVHHKGAKQ